METHQINTEKNTIVVCDVCCHHLRGAVVVGSSDLHLKLI